VNQIFYFKYNLLISQGPDFYWPLC